MDAGPLVALIDYGQGEAHRTCVAALKTILGPLVTTWPCFTEAMYFLGDLKGWNGQETLWQFLERGALDLHISTDSETKRMRVLMEKYGDTPMDLADASLVAIAESGVCIVFSRLIMIFGSTELTARLRLKSFHKTTLESESRHV